MNVSPLLPPAVIGIVGGGQLGRMTALAAAAMGYRCHIFTPEKEAPASHVAWRTTVASYEDTAALLAFARSVQVVTFEFENIPHATLEALAQAVPVHPSPHVLHTAQHRLREKDFIRAQGIGTAPYAAVNSEQGLAESLASLGGEAILKTAELGYDGKGQRRLRSAAECTEAWTWLAGRAAILEGVVPFVEELSVIVARGRTGEIRCFPTVRNVHAQHILATTHAPAEIPVAVAAEAERIARTLAEAFPLVGLLAVEMFLTADGALLVNELAPRPHNSGHWTIDACATSQFEQLIRAVCGLPLGATDMTAQAVMHNLIGDMVYELMPYLKNPYAKLHLYGKTEARPGRKMGHVTVLKPFGNEC